jgi:hypothetical protein
VVSGGGHGLDATGGAATGTNKLANDLGEAEHVSDSDLEGLSQFGTVMSNVSRSITVAGAAGTFANDYLLQNHSLAYSVGDAGASTAGAWGGAIAGSAACGGPEDGVGILCGAVGGFVGGGGAHWVYSKVFG